MHHKDFVLQSRSFQEKLTRKKPAWRIKEFFLTNKFLFTVLVLCLGTLATVYNPDQNGIKSLKGHTKVTGPQIRSRALRRASWDTFVDTSKPTRGINPFVRQKRAFVSSLYTPDYFPLALAMGYSLAQTNNLAAQNAEMVLFVRKGANISTDSLDKLRRIGWKLRIEDDIVLKNVNIEEIQPWHRWNLNKLRFWSWTEYDQILFIDADTLVKGDLSEVWKTPGSKLPR